MAKDSPDQSSADKQLTGYNNQPLSEREIQVVLLIDSLQDKRSLLPLAISAIAFIYSWLYPPVLGGQVISLDVAFAAAIVGISVLIWRYMICYRKNYTLKFRELMVIRLTAQNRYMAKHCLAETHAFLKTGLPEINAAEGMNILLALDQEYRSLGAFFCTGEDTELLSILNLEFMLNETYIRGLSVLEDAFVLERAIHTTDEDRLQVEIEDLQRKAAAAPTDPASQVRIGHIDERIATNQERIHIVSQYRQREEELLYQAKRCEAALGKTRIELAALKTNPSETGVDALIDALRNTIDRASQVQKEMGN